MSNIVLYFGLILLLRWYIQSQKIFDYIFIGKFLTELRECNYCISFWISTGLFWIFELNILDFISIPEYPMNYLYYGISWVITSIFSSFIVSVFITGWDNLFRIHYIK